jgi:phosphoribosyl-AMP cyclohydrolase
MTSSTGRTLVFDRDGDHRAIETGDTFQPLFTGDGLIPAIVTSREDGAVLMFAWMNADALEATLQTRIAHFYSRSRDKLWRKGEESGNTLTVHQIATDCDQDVIWLKVTVNGAGVACHTGARSCFYREIDLDAVGEGAVHLKPA